MQKSKIALLGEKFRLGGTLRIESPELKEWIQNNIKIPGRWVGENSLKKRAPPNFLRFSFFWAGATHHATLFTRNLKGILGRADNYSGNSRQTTGRASE